VGCFRFTEAHYLLVISRREYVGHVAGGWARGGKGAGALEGGRVRGPNAAGASTWATWHVGRGLGLRAVLGPCAQRARAGPPEPATAPMAQAGAFPWPRSRRAEQSSHGSAHRCPLSPPLPPGHKVYRVADTELLPLGLSVQRLDNNAAESLAERRCGGRG
jgi:hypothetical protein